MNNSYISTQRKNPSYWNSILIGLIRPCFYLPLAVCRTALLEMYLGFQYSVQALFAVLHQTAYVGIMALLGKATLATQEEIDQVLNSQQDNVE